MKSFLSFITEAKSSVAAQQAARMGLTGDGHGGWYDSNGEFVAKTEKGRLVFFNKRQAAGKDPAQTDAEKATSQPTEGDPAAAQAAPEAAAAAPEAQAQQQAAAPEAQQQAAAGQEQPKQTAPADVPKTKGTLTIAFGRFNPPTVGHEKLLKSVAKNSDDNEYIIVPSRSNDPKKNPFDVDRKVALMRQMFPDHAERIVNDPGNRTIFDVLRKAHNDGYTNVRIMGGEDRVKEFEKLTNKYNGSTYQFDNIEVISAGNRDPDSDSVEGMSASKMRKAAADNDFRVFRKGIPNTIDNDTAIMMFKELQNAMGVTLKMENPDKTDAKPKAKSKSKAKTKTKVETWEIAPKLDYKNLRENYIRGNIFNIGDSVEHMPTGLSGTIYRKGTNHLICVTEDGTMFKTWVQDVTTITDISHSPAISTPTEREVGTDTLTNFLQRLTPGERVRAFINKKKRLS